MDIPNCGLPLDAQLLVQTLLYFATVLSGFATAVLTSVTQNQFSGECFLYIKGSWSNTTYLDFNFGSSGVCNFITYAIVFVCILYGLAMGIYFAYAVYTSYNDITIGQQMWVMPFLLANSVALFIVFIVGCVLGIGISQTCTLLTSGSYMGNGILQCSQAEYYQFDDNWNDIHYNFGAFLTHYNVAQSALWITFLFWIVQIVLGGLRFYRNRKLAMGGTYMGAGEMGDPTVVTPDTKPIVDEEPTA